MAKQYGWAVVNKNGILQEYVLKDREYGNVIVLAFRDKDDAEKLDRGDLGEQIVKVEIKVAK